MLLYNKTIDSSLVQAVHDSRYALLNKAIVGIVDVNNDAAERIERLFNINVTTDVPKYIMIKPKNENNEFFKYKEDYMDPI